MTAFAAGMLASLTLALSMGPGLALQFQACIQRGVAGGMAVVIARYLSDMTLLSLSYIGVLQVLASSRNQYIGGIAGSAACIGFGLVFLLKKSDHTFSPVTITRNRNPKSFFSYFIASLVINTMNPFVMLYWMGLVAFAGSSFGVRSNPFFYFFSGLLSTAFVFDVVKCSLFSQIKLRLKPRYFRWINRFTGISLVIAGTIILIKLLSIS